jgi:hypothetical protein
MHQLYDTLTYIEVWLLDGVCIRWLDLLTTCTHHSELQVITAPPLISTIHSSPQHPLCLFQLAVSSPAVPWQRLLTVKIVQFSALRSFLRRLSFRTACQLIPQLKWVAISSQLPLQSSTAHSTQLTGLSQLSLPYSYFARTEQKRPFSRMTIIACISAAVGTCLPSRCLSVDVCSGSTIPPFRRNVTILTWSASMNLKFSFQPSLMFNYISKEDEMDGACSTHGAERNSCMILVEKPEG